MDFKRLLLKVREQVQKNGVGAYCYVCGESPVLVEKTPAGEFYICEPGGHRSDRIFFFDGKAVYRFDEHGITHETAGAIIQREQAGQRYTLLFLRRKYPLQYTIPAGHVEIGNQPENEARREVFEETGLRVKKIKPLWQNEVLHLHDPCRRGADWHIWHVYLVEAEGIVQLSEEGRIIGWYSDDEVRELASMHMLTEPVAGIFKRLGFI
jgi:ADP-ribose pyrophosphatase YjhB (NUDIX family)